MYAELTLNGKCYGTYVAMPPMDDYHFKTYLPGVKHRAIFKGNYGDDLPVALPLSCAESRRQITLSPTPVLKAVPMNPVSTHLTATMLPWPAF